MAIVTLILYSTLTTYIIRYFLKKKTIYLIVQETTKKKYNKFTDYKIGAAS